MKTHSMTNSLANHIQVRLKQYVTTDNIWEICLQSIVRILILITPTYYVCNND
jgi:hypothetical protein